MYLHDKVCNCAISCARGLLRKPCVPHCDLLSMCRVTQTHQQPRNTMNGTPYFFLSLSHAFFPPTVTRLFPHPAVQFLHWSCLSRSLLHLSQSFIFRLLDIQILFLSLFFYSMSGRLAERLTASSAKCFFFLSLSLFSRTISRDLRVITLSIYKSNIRADSQRTKVSQAFLSPECT